MINQQQLKHLRERVSVAERKHRDAAHKKYRPKEPDHIRNARLLVKKFDNTRYKDESNAVDRIRDAANKVKGTILFCDADKALAAVEKFERQDPAK